MSDAAILAGLTVIDLGQYLAGPLTATLLADQGARVIHIDPPGGPRMRHPANAFLMRGREAIELDLKRDDDRAKLIALIDTADVLIENFRPGVMARLGIDLDDARARNPKLITCSLPGFAAGDARRDFAAWEGVVMASSGAYWRYAGPPAFPPPLDGPSSVRFSQLPLASVTAAGLAALAIGAALVVRQRDGQGQHIEMPLADAMLEANGILAMQVERPYPMDQWLAFGLGLYRGSDGRVVEFNVVQYRHFTAALEAAGVKDWLDEEGFGYAKLKSDEGSRVALRERLIALFATRPAAEWEQRLQDAGVAAGLVRPMREWLMSAPPLAAATLADLDDPDLGKTRMPGAAVTFSDAPSALRPRGAALPATSASPIPVGSVSDDAPLAGLHVLDLTRVVAAPTSSRLLADLGATVLKIDIDPAVMTSAAKEPIVHIYVNRGKRGLVLDLNRPEDRADFQRLVERADLLVNNFRISGISRLGVDEVSLRAINPGLILSYLNAYGSKGPWAAHRGYAEVINAITGIADMTSGWGDKPSGALPDNDPPWPYTDSIAGIISAYGAVLAIFDKARTGRVQRVETCLAAAGALELLPYSVAGEGDAAPVSLRDAMGWDEFQRIHSVTDGWIFLGTTARDLPELMLRLDVTDVADIAAAIARMDKATAIRRLTFGQTAAAASEPSAHNLMAGGQADRRGLRLELPSSENGAIITQDAVMTLSRSRAKAGQIPKPFGSEGRQDVLAWFLAS